MSQVPSEELKNVFNVLDTGKEDDTGRPFSGGLGILDDLQTWACKLESLGDAISSMAFADSQNKCDSSLASSGEQLGYIIKDYAKAIFSVLGTPEMYSLFKKAEEERRGKKL